MKSASKVIGEWWRTHLPSMARNVILANPLNMIAHMGYELHMRNKRCGTAADDFLSFLSQPDLSYLFLIVTES